MNLQIIVIQLVLALIAIFANLLSAFSGGGAGLVQLPALILLGLPFSKALATHKLASIALGLGAAIRHSKEKKLDFFFSLFILCCGLPGVLIGANIIIFIPTRIATLCLGLLTLWLGFISSRSSGSNQRKNSFHKWSLDKKFLGGAVLFLIGVLNGSLASGTGLFVTIWLVSWFGFSYSRAIAYTLVLVGIFWNGTGALVLGLNGEVQWNWLPVLICGSLIGGYLGAHLSLVKEEKLVKKAFEIISIAMGLSLITKSFL